MLAKRRSCNESATRPRILVSTTKLGRTWWVFRDLKMHHLIISTSLNLLQRYTPLTTYIHKSIWPYPYQRGIHDINRSFAFKSNPGFIFHNSSGFETGDEKQLQEVLSFMEKRAKSADIYDQLHAIWWVSLSRRTYLPLKLSSLGERFCLVLNNARPLFPLEKKFFEGAKGGKGFYSLIVF